jgi:hypothetical protein
MILAAHWQSAWRANLSTTILLQATQGGVDFLKALAAALLTLGGLHAPLSQAWAALQWSDATLASRASER